MKKTFVSILCICLLLPLLSGCHGSRGLDDFVVPENFDTTRQYEITFWAKNDTNKAQIAVYQDAIDSFEKLYPNIHVNVKWYTDYKRIYNDVITNIATNTTPNVCISYPDHVATYLSGNNVVVSLDELIADDEYGLAGSKLKFDGPSEQEIVPEFYNEGILNGHMYLLPYMRSTEALYINKTLLNKLGYEIPELITWDFIWEVCEKAMEKDAEGNFVINGQKTFIPFMYKSTDNMMISMLKQLGAEYSNEQGDILMFNDDCKTILNTIAEHTSNGCFSTFTRDSYPGNFLNANQCIFAIDSTAGATWMGCEAPNMDIPESDVREFEMVVTIIPQYDENNIRMMSQGPSICLFNKEDNQEVLASWLFAQYLLSNDVQIAYAQTEGYVPVTTKAQQSEEYQNYLSLKGMDDEHYWAKIEASELLMANTEHTFTTAVFNGSASLREASGELIERVVSGCYKKETIDNDYINKIFDEVTKLKRLDQIGIVLSEVELGELPSTSKGLLIALCCVWVALGGYNLSEYLKNRKKKQVEN